MINVNYRDPRPIYLQLKDSLKKQILSGVLAEGEKLPSVRELSAQLAVNPNTIQRAYRELESEGYICSVPGKGSFAGALPHAVSAQQEALKQQFLSAAAELLQMGVPGDDLIKLLQEEAMKHD